MADEQDAPNPRSPQDLHPFLHHGESWHGDDGTNRASDPGEGCPPTVDHWVLHDPHAGGGGQKPFRLGTKTHALPDLTQATAMPTGPIPLCASSKQLASKEFSYIVQRAQIQARKRRKKEKRAKRQRALDAEERKKRLAEEEYARAAAAERRGLRRGGRGRGRRGALHAACERAAGRRRPVLSDSAL